MTGTAKTATRIAVALSGREIQPGFAAVGENSVLGFAVAICPRPFG
jgi:hypothetical protein